MSGLERPVRVLLVGRHFWPQGSIDSAGHLMALATALKAAGLNVSVLSPSYSGSWAERFSFREFPVYRPIRMFRSGWTARGDRSASRYIRSLRQWIESNPMSCDLVYCNGCREEAIAVVEAARARSLASVIEIAGHGSSNDFDFFEQSRMGKRCQAAALESDAVVLESATAHRRWLALGGESKRTHRIPVGIGPTQDQTLASQKRLRQAMARINGDLHVPETCSVVLSVERMHRDSGIMSLVNAAYSLSQTIQGLQFWLIGDGPIREAIYNQLKGDGLRQSTAMPGSFGCGDDVFAAADLLVHAGEEGFRSQIPMAISAALPLVIANTAGAREFFGATQDLVEQQIILRREAAAASLETSSLHPAHAVWWFDPARPKTLRFAIQQIVSNTESARGRAQMLRKLLQRTRSQSDSIQQYVTLFRELVRNSSRHVANPSLKENAR